MHVCVCVVSQGTIGKSWLHTRTCVKRRRHASLDRGEAVGCVEGSMGVGTEGKQERQALAFVQAIIRHMYEKL